MYLKVRLKLYFGLFELFNTNLGTFSTNERRRQKVVFKRWTQQTGWHQLLLWYHAGAVTFNKYFLLNVSRVYC